MTKLSINSTRIYRTLEVQSQLALILQCIRLVVDHFIDFGSD